MKAGKYLESKNGKYKLEFQNSGLHLSCGSTTIWKYGFSNNEALYFDSDGLTLALISKNPAGNRFYKSVAIWNSSTGGRANKLVLQDDGNLVLCNDYNKTIWQTNTNGACSAGLEQFFYIKSNTCFKIFLYLIALFQVKIRQEQ